MAVKMLTSMAGDSWAVNPGDKYESDAAHEARLIAEGYAEAWPDEPKPEKAKGKK